MAALRYGRLQSVKSGATTDRKPVIPVYVQTPLGGPDQTLPGSPTSSRTLPGRVRPCPCSGMWHLATELARKVMRSVVSVHPAVSTVLKQLAFERDCFCPCMGHDHGSPWTESQRHNRRSRIKTGVARMV